MARIKLDPEQLQASASQIWHAANRLDRIRSNTRSAYRHLSSEDLDYRSRARIESWVRNADRLGRKLETETQDLARQLERIADRFANADRQYSDLFSRITNQLSESIPVGLLPVGMGLASLSGLLKLGQTAGQGIADELYWVDTGNALSGLERLTVSGLKYLSKSPLTDYRSWGRYINTNWAHNLKGGWVGRMDQAGHIMKPAAKIGIPIVSGIFAYAKDDDPDRMRAAGTAAAEILIEEGITAVGGGLVLGANSAFQLYGDLAEEGAKMAGRMYGGEWEEIFYQQAYSLDDNFDRIDLGNVTHDLAHIVVDSFPITKYGNPAIMSAEFSQASYRVASGQSTWSAEFQNVSTEISAAFNKTGQDAADLWGHVSDIPGGLLDTIVDNQTTFQLSSIATLDKGVSALPIPAEWKNTVHASCLETGQRLADMDQTLGRDLIDFFSSDGMEGITGVVH